MVPAHRNSKSKQGRRRSHLALPKMKLQACKNCQAPKLPHYACSQCGVVRHKARV